MPRASRTSPSHPPSPSAPRHEVVTALGRIEDDLLAGATSTSRRWPAARSGLLDVLDRVLCSQHPEIADEVLAELSRRLPTGLQGLARRRPRLALAVHDDLSPGSCRSLDLVRAAHRDLGGAPRHPSAANRRPAPDLNEEPTPRSRPLCGWTPGRR